MNVLTRSAKLLSLLRLSNNDISYVKVWLEASNLLFISIYLTLFTPAFYTYAIFKKQKIIYLNV